MSVQSSLTMVISHQSNSNMLNLTTQCEKHIPPAIKVWNVLLARSWATQIIETVNCRLFFAFLQTLLSYHSNSSVPNLWPVVCMWKCVCKRAERRLCRTCGTKPTFSFPLVAITLLILVCHHSSFPIPSVVISFWEETHVETYHINWIYGNKIRSPE